MTLQVMSLEVQCVLVMVKGAVREGIKTGEDPRRIGTRVAGIGAVSITAFLILQHYKPFK